MWVAWLLGTRPSVLVEGQEGGSLLWVLGASKANQILGQVWASVAMLRPRWLNSWGQEGPAGHGLLASECQAWATEWTVGGPELALPSSLGRHFLPSLGGLPGEFRGPSSRNRGLWEEVQVGPGLEGGEPRWLPPPFPSPLRRALGEMGWLVHLLPWFPTLPGAKSFRPWMVSLSTG